MGGWAAVSVDPALFEHQPRLAEAPSGPPQASVGGPAVAGAAPTEQSATGMSKAAAALQAQAAATRRPMTGDSTETDILDNVPMPPRLRNDASKGSIGSRPGARAPTSGRGHELPGVGGGWDLSIEEVQLNPVEKERSRGGRKFWKPWKQTVRVSSTHTVNDEDAVEALGGAGDPEADAMHRGASVDDRISTPWTAQESLGGIEELCALPGVMEEDPRELADRIRSMKHPPKQAGVAMDDIDDIDVL